MSFEGVRSEKMYNEFKKVVMLKKEKMIVETRIDGETFTHKVLWECCLSQMETAKRRKKGSMYFHISAMLLAYLTYEAYINFLGDRFASDTWRDEKEFFSKKPYQGLEGRLKFLAEKIPIEGIDKSQRPYQTLKKLKTLRDFLSHGKIDKYERIIHHSRDKEPPLFGRYGILDELVTAESAKKAVLDVKQFIRFLHQQAMKRTNDLWFGEDPFDGFRGHASSDSRVVRHNE